MQVDGIALVNKVSFFELKSSDKLAGLNC